MKPAKPELITLDHYMDFLENPHSNNLTNSHLHQIIAMHGYKKLNRQPKKCLLNALNSMDLLSPSRSTLKDNISACATLTKEDVMKDLEALEWSECSLQSIESINGSIEETFYEEYPNPKVQKPQKSLSELSVMVKKKTGKRKARIRKWYPSAPLCLPAPDWVSAPVEGSYGNGRDFTFWQFPALADFSGPALFHHVNSVGMDSPFLLCGNFLDIDSKENVVRL